MTMDSQLANASDISNLVGLSVINDAVLLHTIRSRFSKDRIYVSFLFGDYLNLSIELD